jgi:outer membrane protein assembly factor BamB
VAVLAVRCSAQVDPLSPWPMRGGGVRQLSRGSTFGGPSYNCSLVFKVTLNATIRSPPAVGADGTVYIGADNGVLYAWYPNGVVRWARGADDSFWGNAFYENSPALSATGVLFIANNNFYMYALNAATGSLIWRRATGFSVRSTPVISLDGTTLYFGSLDGYLWALWTATGTLRWRTHTGNQIISAPALSISGATVYTGSLSNAMFAMR